MTDHPEHVPTERTRRHTGVVSLIVSGDRPTPISGGEILEAATSAEYSEDDGITREYEGGRIEYVPTQHSPDAVTETLMQGRLLYRFTIYGNPPIELEPLTPGKYYMYVDFVEGPDFDEGRWVGRIVDETGTVVGIVPGVEVKQVVSFHIDDRARDAHSRPEVHTHGLGVGEVARLMRADLPSSTDKWTVTSGDWQAHGNGCMRTFYCTPAVVVAFKSR